MNDISPERVEAMESLTEELMKIIHLDEMAGLHNWLAVANEEGEVNDHLIAYVGAMTGCLTLGDLEMFYRLGLLAAHHGYLNVLEYYFAFALNSIDQ